MSTSIVPLSSEIERVLIGGDLSKLTPDQRVSFYNATCESLGLNPLTKPFQYITLNGKMVLYATKDCTEQLRSTRNVSVKIVSREVVEGCYVVTAQAALPTGRCDESIGAVPIDSLKGEARSNAFMKAETKAKRRVTLSICGLGLLDESEVDSIPGAITGSREAQIEVRDRKLKAIPAPIETTPHFVEPELRGTDAILPEIPEARYTAQQTEAEAVLAEGKPKAAKRKKGDIGFDALKHFGIIKKELSEVTGDNKAYYDVLETAGVAHADELAHELSREVYKALGKVLGAQRAEKDVRAQLTKEWERIGTELFLQCLGNNGFANLDELLSNANAQQEQAILADLKML